MNRKTILVILVLVALFVIALAIRPSLTTKETAAPDNAESLQQESMLSNEEAAPGDKENPADEAQEPQGETPLFNGDNEDIETIDVGDEVIIDIGESEAVGGM